MVNETENDYTLPGTEVMPYVDIVIVNWNGLRYLAPCLDALNQQTFTDYQVWLVDNGSTDGSVDFLRHHYPKVRLICNPDNKGFAEANNQGIRAGNARYVATLNNDTVADPRWLEALVHVLDDHPPIGMAASLMLFADRPEMINSAGIAIDRAGIAWDVLGGQPLSACPTQLTPVFGACAGAALYRRAMLDEIGLFDEDFFAYLEDVDLAWRAQWARWQALLAPQARVLHHHSATSGEGSPFKSYLLGRNKVWLIAKNYPTPQLWWYLPMIVMYDLAAVLFALTARRDGSALHGRIEGVRKLPTIYIKAHKRYARITASAMCTLLDPVIWPWNVPMRYSHLKSKS